MRIVVVFVLAAGLAPAQIQGVFTVDPSRPPSSLNFQTLTAAVTAARVIRGPVVFKVKPGTYRETLTLGRISDAGASATVSFVGDGGTVVLSAPPSDPRYGLNFRYGSWYRFKDFKVTNYLRYGIRLEGANDNVFERCEVDDGYGLWPSIAAVYTRTGSDRNTFLRCVFRGTGQTLCTGAAANVFDSCEFDGLGKASVLLWGPVRVVRHRAPPWGRGRSSSAIASSASTSTRCWWRRSPAPSLRSFKTTGGFST